MTSFPADAARTPRRAGLLAAIGLLYASACGGPYGTEDFVAKVGPGLLVTLIVLGAIVWGLPLSLATAELSARRPIEGGYYRWVREFLGDTWGCHAGLWSLMSSILDNALYPVLFAQALGYVLPGVGPVARWFAAVGFIFFLTWLNIRGIRIVGAAAVGLNLFLIAPLIWMVLAALPRLRFNPFVPFSAGGSPLDGLSAGLALAVWFHSGYSEVSTAAEEIEQPRRTIPLVLLIVTPLVIISYVLPMIVGLAATDGWHDWESGHFATIGRLLGGPVLGHWALLASVASFVVIFMSYLLWWSRLAWAFAADGFLPGWLVQRHPRHGTPHRVLILYAVLYAILAAFPFEELLIVDVWLFGAYDALLVWSVLRARRTADTNPEGFRLPGGTAGIVINALVLTVTWAILLVTTAREEPKAALAGAALLGAGAAAVPFLARYSKRPSRRTTQPSG
jgi:amino acid transporter